MVDMNRGVSFRITIGYEKVNSMSMSLQQGNISIFDLPNEPDHDYGSVFM